MGSNPFLHNRDIVHSRSSGDHKSNGVGDNGATTAILASIGLTEQEVVALFAESIHIPIGDPITEPGTVAENSFAAKTAVFLAGLVTEGNLSTMKNIQYGKWLYSWQGWKNSLTASNPMTAELRHQIFAHPVGSKLLTGQNLQTSTLLENPLMKALYRMV